MSKLDVAKQDELMIGSRLESESISILYDQFASLIELDDSANQLERLAAIAVQDKDLADELHKLLFYHSDAGVLDKEVVATDWCSVENKVLKPGDKIGQYWILRQIGEGGMGQVYVAEQRGSLRRLVAIKVLNDKPGIEKERFSFEAERNALCRLEHDGIARVYDAGQCADGRNYLVMELIWGLPITEFCDRNKFSLEKRLRLFVDICHAIHHAHQKGIIHRDLKPSNILVSDSGGHAKVKVIDFGIAKTLHIPWECEAEDEGQSVLAGTLNYMSPEQIENTDDDIDIRSDVYSLGIVLYELLSGTVPNKIAMGQAWVRLVEISRQKEPLRPSIRFAELIEDEKLQANRIAEERMHSCSSLRRSLSRGLDWIVLKAIRKSRSHRYDSTVAIAADIERYLNNDTVAAVEPSLWYRVSCFYARYRTVCAAGVIVVLAMIVATLLSGYWAIVAGVANDSLRKQRAELERQLQRVSLLKKKSEYAESTADKLKERRANIGLICRVVQEFYEDAWTDPNFDPIRLMATIQLFGSREYSGDPIASNAFVGCRTILYPDHVDASNGGGYDTERSPHQKLMSFAVMESLATKLPENSLIARAIKNGESVLHVDLIREEIKLLEMIRNDQIEKFGSNATWVAETCNKMARRYLEIGEPLRGQLAVQRAIYIYEMNDDQEYEDELCSSLALLGLLQDLEAEQEISKSNPN